MESEHFKDHELACPCCGDNWAAKELLEGLEALRHRIGDKPIKPNSICRCVRHNKDVGGEQNSYHLKGMAADIKVFGMTPEEVAAYALEIFGGVIVYPSWVHVDTRKIRYFIRRA